jgi:hypothetical protein
MVELVNRDDIQPVAQEADGRSDSVGPIAPRSPSASDRPPFTRARSSRVISSTRQIALGAPVRGPLFATGVS